MIGCLPSAGQGLRFPRCGKQMRSDPSRCTRYSCESANTIPRSGAHPMLPREANLRHVSGLTPDPNYCLSQGSSLPWPVQSDKSLKRFHVHPFVGISAPDLPHFVNVVDVIHGLDIGRAYMTQA